MMKQRILRISLVGILVFGLLVGGQILYRNNWVNGQLSQNSSQIGGVISAQVITDNNQKVLEVTTDQVQNLAKVGQQLEIIAGKYPIRLKDQRTPELESLLNQMKFPIEEAIARGNYTQMEETLQHLASQAEVSLELSMDSEGIYVNLTQGQAQLLEVVERNGQDKYLSSKS